MSNSFWGVVLEPVLAHQSLLWLSLLLSWLAPSFSCLCGCSFGNVGTQASVFSVDPLFALLLYFSFRCFPVVSLDPKFPPEPFPTNVTPLAFFIHPTGSSCCPFSFNFPSFFSVVLLVGSLLSPSWEFAISP